MPQGIASAWSALSALMGVVCILFLAWWCSRMLGKTYRGASSGRNLKVIEHLQVGADRQILLLRVKDQVYLLGVSQAGIQMLDRLEGDFEDTEGGSPETMGFKELLGQYARHLKKEGKENE